MAAGNVGTALSQKSRGSSRNSGGDDRCSSASVTRRSFARFARPCVGARLAWEDFPVRLALTATAHSGRNDSSHDVASLSPIGVDHGEEDTVGSPDGDPPHLAIVLACVDALESWAGEGSNGKREIKIAISQVPITLLRIPGKAHLCTIQAYIQSRKGCVWSHVKRGWKCPLPGADRNVPLVNGCATRDRLITRGLGGVSSLRGVVPPRPSIDGVVRATDDPRGAFYQ